MRLQPLLLCLAAMLAGPAAWADVRTFSAGSLIIPMDACYQAAQDQPYPSYCIDGKAPDDGIIKAYGLVYLLLKRGFTIYLIINPAKTTIDGVDLTLSRVGGPPVGLYNRSTRTFVNFTHQTTVHYRGAPFVIDVSEAASVLSLLHTDPRIQSFTSVAIHLAYENFSAPVSSRMNGVPPRIAVFVPPGSQGGVVGTEGIPLMRGYLRRAGLDYEGAYGTVASPGDIFDTLTEQDVINGALGSRYQVAWFPHYSAGSDDRPVLLKVRDFADQGGMIFAECASISTFESHSETQFMTTGGITINTLPQCYPGNTSGFRRGGEPSNFYTTCYNPRTPLGHSPGSRLEFPVPSSPFVQIGDFLFYKARGAVEDWRPRSGSSQRAGVVSLMRSADSNSSYNGQDIVSTTFKDNQPNKGQIIYFGGHFYGDSTAPATAGIRIVLNTLLFARPTLSTRYQARSQPVMAEIDGRLLLLMGSYMENNASIAAYSRASDINWPFPQVLGQFRAYDARNLTIGTQHFGSDQGSLWNAANLLPSPGSRVIYTSRQSGANATLVRLTQANLPALGTNPFGLPPGYTAADEAFLLARIHQAPFGGVDHSTAAVVGPQTVVPGGEGRPTMAYVGALDGMLHAIMVRGPQSQPGVEQWAFLPGEQLSSVRFNAAALDGSPTVGDIFESIGGMRRWRTLLTIPQGHGGGALYGLDVSDPLAPALLWQRGTAASGVLLAPAHATAMTICPTANNPFQSFVVVASARVTGAPGITVSALSGKDGSLLWQWSTGYTRTLPATGAIIPNDLPAPAALAASSPSAPCEDRVYVADLDGRVWELDTITGQNVNGSAPLADVGLTPGGRVQPIGAAPALYNDLGTGRRMLAVVTGGADWAHGGDTYALYVYDISAQARVPGRPSGVATLSFRQPFPPGHKGYAPPTVSGNDLYLLAATGTLGGSISATLGDAAVLYRVNLSSRQVTATMNLTKGAGGFLAAPDGTIYGATARDLVRLTPGGADRRGSPLRNNTQSPLQPRIYLETP
ncbi:MAG: PilC/PilY family type IV pilus protein [Myxococcales bacterium]|nr:PilC/PilY family type IV pilus protein [Myxococcota bacterium]MDW8283066.1 PilC/PilY family type IV pilus protein [Myxococcales bacterium]